MWRRLKRILLLATALAVVCIAALSIRAWPQYREFQRIADSFDLDEIHRIPALSEIYDANGQRYSRLDGEVRYVVPFDEISPHFIDALLAREDNRFFDHHGVDPAGIARAAIRNLRAGTVKEGASTITQQLARNTFDLGEDKWRRKCIEALLAMRIEQRFTKQEILEAYANRIFYGVGLYGVETASRACFGKSAKDLTLSEAAILAGLIRSPNRFSPLEDTQTALRERDQVLGQMEALKMITPDEAATARAEPMPLAKRIPPAVRRNYAIDAVMHDLSILVPKKTLAQGGLRIFTTIDPRVQLIAEDAVEKQLSKVEADKDWPHPRKSDTSATEPGDPSASGNRTDYLQGALVAIDNETGGILALVGGRDYAASPFNRAIDARRQIGSTFKPFVYATAFEHGLLPGTLVDDAPLAEAEISNIKWSPENSDGENLGPTPAAIGLIRSRNTMTVRVGEMVGREQVRKLAATAGLGDIPSGPAIYLGAFETSLKDLTAAYTMFANGGVRRQPFIIDHIEDRTGKTVYRATRADLRCLTPAVAFVMQALLEEVLTKGTAASAESLGLTIPALGKTGTTDDYKDAWFVGCTTRLTCGVWVGMDRPQRIADRAYGSRMALPVWVRFMEEASSFKYTAGNFPEPQDLQAVQLCRESGLLAGSGCAVSTYEARLPAAEIPTTVCEGHGLIAASNAPPVARAVPVSSTARRTIPAPGSPPIRRAEPVVNPNSHYRIVPIPGGHRFEYTE